MELQLDGCWTKRWHFTQLCHAIQRVMQGQPVFSTNADFGQLSTNSKVEAQPRLPISRVELLTPREFQIFQLLASGFSVRECAESLELAESTVDNHKTNLMRKLQIHKAAQLAWLAAKDQWMTKPITPREVAIQMYDTEGPLDDIFGVNINQKYDG